MYHTKKKNVYRIECKQLLSHLGRNKFWGSLTRRNVMNRPRKVKYFMSKNVFQNYGDKKFTKISNKRIQETTKAGIKKYEYDAINAKKFYKLIGVEYCYKKNGEGGHFYMDNIKIRYNLSDMNVEFEYIVVEWDKNNNRGRSRPAYW